jgi:hypothetical protein
MPALRRKVLTVLYGQILETDDSSMDTTAVAAAVV